MTGGAQRAYLSDTHALIRVKWGKTLVLVATDGRVCMWVKTLVYPFRLLPLARFHLISAVDRMATTMISRLSPYIVFIITKTEYTVANKVNRLKKKEWMDTLIMEEFISSLRANSSSIVHDRCFVDMWRKHAVCTVKRNLKGGFPRPYVKTSSLSDGGRRQKDRNRPVRWLRNRMVIVTSDGRYRLAA